MSEAFDVVVIGGGPGGYIAAIRAAQLGLKTACIDKRGRFGGTCLNIGCIPSKALLHATELYDQMGHLARLGIKVEGVAVDLPAMLAHKDKTVDELTRGIGFLLKKHKIEAIVGAARFTGPNAIEVTLNDGGTRTLTAKNTIIATGSDSIALPGMTIDEKRVVTSTGALSFAEVPKHLVVIGGGVIGLELGSVWSRLGAKVTVVEFLDRITPTMDGEVSKNFQRILTKQGLAFKLGAKVTKVEDKGADKPLVLTLEPSKGGEAETLEADAVLVAVGRRPYVDGLNVEAAGVALDARGRVAIDGHFRTNVAGIWAIGDVVQGAMLAHKAEHEGVAVAETIAGQAGHVNHDAIPSVVYTAPEVAAIGKTEEELKAAGIAYRIGKFPFTANARAKANLETDGFVKILADAATDRVLGAHIIGAHAGDLIAEVALAMEFGASSEDIARTSHPHPSISEAIKEAALDVDKRTLNL
ncbi:dihydrolipoyl dehydrogenase [Zavarzinia sp. CC-PAN008]|uniref:dihydrolipoyl dehydrogenase n=1 Tax=Zavarzinia sp. CC-PAN008 TaxID=3243332 RepID=UPI003F748965